MTGRFFSYQIFWKEYRQMRGFWLGLSGITVLLQVIVCFTAHGAAANSLYGVAICFTVLYALGCGATAFALEHENGTYDYLRSLPIKGIPTFISKIAFTVVSAPLLVLASSASAAILGLRMVPLSYVPTATALLQAVGTALLLWAVGSSILFVWAAFFSLLMHHVVKAALLGGCAAVVSVLLVGSLVEAFLGPQGDTGWLVGGAVAAIMAAIDVWLGARWYREASTWPAGGSRTRRAGREDECAYGLETMPTKGSMFGHLVWLQWRQSRGMVLILTAMVVAPLLFSPFLNLHFDLNHWRWLREWIGALFGLSLLAAMTVVPLAGASVFAGDQRQCQFRFLADRGITPRLVWWSRHPVWVAGIVAWLVLLLVPMLVQLGRVILAPELKSHSVFLAFPAATVLSVPLAYCFGQLCSMSFRSGILCGTFAIVGSFFLVYWAFVMSILGVPILWSVLPIPVVLLIATRVRTKGWMLESNRLKSWLAAVLVLLVPGTAIVTGVCLYRAFQYPWVEPGFDVAAFTAPASPAAVETAKMYVRARGLVSNEAQSMAYPYLVFDEATEERHDEAIALALAAGRRRECDWLSKYFGEPRFWEEVQILIWLVRGKGERLQKAGNLDEAAEHYLAVLRMTQHLYPDMQEGWLARHTENMALEDLAGWCYQPGQTKDRILKALREVEALTSRTAPLDNAIKERHATVDKVFQGDLDDLFQWIGPNLIHESVPVLTIYWMPWERERARRRLRMLTSAELERYRQAQSSLAGGHQVSLSPGWRASEENQRPYRSPWWRRATPDAWIDSISFGGASEALVATEWQRRTARIKMALAAWQLDHQSLPEKLEELKGGYLAEIPVDPYSGESFVYFPRGVDVPTTRYVSATGETQVLLEADRPFFWSPGPQFRVDRTKSSPMNKYLLWNGTKTRPAMSPQEVWAGGYIYAIPKPG